jgi:hypothetical protein
VSIWPVEPGDYAGHVCDRCNSDDDVALCSVDGSDKDLCTDCRSELFCEDCGYARRECCCPADDERGHYHDDDTVTDEPSAAEVAWWDAAVTDTERPVAS